MATGDQRMPLLGGVHMMQANGKNRYLNAHSKAVEHGRLAVPEAAATATAMLVTCFMHQWQSDLTDLATEGYCQCPGADARTVESHGENPRIKRQTRRTKQVAGQGLAVRPGGLLVRHTATIRLVLSARWSLSLSLSRSRSLGQGKRQGSWIHRSKLWVR